MKILLTSLYYYPSVGGVETSLKYLAKKLVESGHRVEILSFDKKDESIMFEEVDGIRINRYKFIPSVFPNINHLRIHKAAKEAIEDITRTFEPDEIWSRNAFVTYGLIRSPLVKKVKHIFPTTSHLNISGLYNNIQNFGFFKRVGLKLLKFLDEKSLSHIDKIIAHSPKVILFVFSEMMKRQILEEVIDLCKQIHVVDPGVDLDVFNIKKDSLRTADIVRMFPVLKEPFALYVGRIANAKNLDLLVDSFDYLNNLNLIIVGDGPSSKTLKEYVSSKKLGDRIFFLGNQKQDLAVIYNLATLTVLPTKIETFGQVLIESLACGTPVVGFGNSPEFKTASEEIIVSRANGVIANQFSAECLARSIDDLVTSITAKPDYFNEINVDYVKKRFSWTRTVENILAVN